MAKDLYVFYNPDTKRTKIGISQDVYKRLRQIRNASGCNVWCLFISDFDKDKMIKEWDDDVTTLYVETLEKNLHTYFSKYRGIGEWFHLYYLDVVDYIVKTYGIQNKVSRYLIYSRPLWLNFKYFKEFIYYYSQY